MTHADRILIADDEVTFAESTAELLRLRAYSCDCAHSAEEARAAIRRAEYPVC